MFAIAFPTVPGHHRAPISVQAGRMVGVGNKNCPEAVSKHVLNSLYLLRGRNFRIWMLTETGQTATDGGKGNGPTPATLSGQRLVCAV